MTCVCVSVAFLFESTFAFWASWRGYNVAASMKANNLSDEITKLPLCEGKSIVSEEFCPDLVNIVNDQIPPEFWKNMEDEDTLQNHEYWKHILSFSANCQKRKKYEDIIRHREGGSPDTKGISIPAPGVPDNL